MLKLARHEYFRVAWDLYGFANSLGYITPDAYQAWVRALRKVGAREQDGATEEESIPRATAQTRPTAVQAQVGI